MQQGKKSALAGNRTRVARVASEHSTTEPPVLVIHWCGSAFWSTPHENMVDRCKEKGLQPERTVDFKWLDNRKCFDWNRYFSLHRSVDKIDIFFGHCCSAIWRKSAFLARLQNQTKQFFMLICNQCFLYPSPMDHRLGMMMMSARVYIGYEYRRKAD